VKLVVLWLVFIDIVIRALAVSYIALPAGHFVLFKVIGMFVKQCPVSPPKLTFTRWFFVTKREISFIFDVRAGKSERRLPV